MSSKQGSTPSISRSDETPPQALKGLLNPAETEVQVHRTIRHRWSPRIFADRRVSAETLRALLEAARWAPSSYNEQPWRFVVATDRDPEAHRKLLKLLTEGNQEWAAGASVLMISFAHLALQKTGKPNRLAEHDVGQAVAQLTIEAVSRGLFVHQMGGIHIDPIIEAYDLPEEIIPMAAIAIGYPPGPDDLDEKEREKHLKERSRKGVDELILSGAL